MCFAWPSAMNEVFEIRRAASQRHRGIPATRIPTLAELSIFPRGVIKFGSRDYTAIT